ncbi:MAG: DUF5722 domain-containing protein [Clostridia bacterium]|nr:DUF5722 domain-containing protein [Clostridia bacterium]
MKIQDAGLRHRGRLCLLPYGVYGALILVLLILCMSMPAFARHAECSAGTAEITAALDTKNNGDILVKLTPDSALLAERGGETLYLFAVRPTLDDTSLDLLAPVATAVLSEKTVFTVKDDGSGERIYTGFQAAFNAAGTYVPFGDPVYIDNPELAAKNTADRAELPSIKGLTVSQNYLSDALNLGISHAVIPISLDRYLSLDRSDAAYSVSHGGVSTNFDKDSIDRLDAEVAALRAQGVHIYFRFVLGGSLIGSKTPAAELYAADAAEASLYAPLSTDKEAFQLLRGVFSYFAERYAAAPGYAQTDFILGDQVTERTEWNTAGGVSDEDYAKAYAMTFRIADTALRSVSANSRVYVPISNLFGAAKPFLRAFAKEMDGAAWNVAAAPYAVNPMSDAVWKDSDASSGTPMYLTMGNLQVLGDLLSRKEFLYRGKMRSVIIDDFAVHGTSGDAASCQRQAASIAYAYYQAASAKFIDAFIYHRLCDAAGEHCSYGLRQLDYTPKASYELYRLIDTDRGEALSRTFLPETGAKRWSSLVDGYSTKRIETVYRTDVQAAAPEYVEKRWVGESCLDFLDNTLHGFFPSVHTVSAERFRYGENTLGIHQTVLRFTAAQMPYFETAGVIRLLDGDESSALRGKDAIGVTVFVTSPDSRSTVNLTLDLGQSGKGEKSLFTGTAEVPVGTWTTVAFPLRDYLKNANGADYLKLSVDSGIGDWDGDFVVALDEILLYKSKTAWVGSLVGVIFGILLMILLGIGVAILRARIIRRRKRRKAMEARRRYLENQRRMAAGRPMGSSAAQNPAQKPAPQRPTAAQPPMTQQTPRTTQQMPRSTQAPRPTPQRRMAQRTPDLSSRSAKTNGANGTGKPSDSDRM